MSGVTNGKPLQALVEIGIEDRPRHESEATERSEPGSVREARSDGTCNRAPSPASSGNERSLAIASASFSRSSLSPRSEEHTSELQSLMRNSYAVFCLKKKQAH